MSRPEPFFGEAGSGPGNPVRLALPEDIAACFVLRGQTRENAISAERLAALGITAQSWAYDVRSGTLTGFVSTEDDTIVGMLSHTDLLRGLAEFGPN